MEAYKSHDVGEEVLVKRLEAHGYRVEQHGDDARHADEVLMGDGPDLAVYSLRDRIEQNDDGLGSTYIDKTTGQFVPEEYAYELVSYVEIKTKESPEWFGRANLRHVREYVNFANEVDVPVWIWFALVDTDDEVPVVHREGFLQVEDMDQVEGDVIDVTDDVVVFHIEDIYSVADGKVAVDGDDIVEVRGGDVIVDHIPDVHGNNVVEFDDDEFRSFPHFMYIIGEGDDD